MNKKLNAKDFILIGVLTALMWIICMIISTVMSIAGPVTNVFYPAVVAIPNGIVMMLLLAKVPKKGVFTICGTIQGILFLLVGGFWLIPVALIVGGVICDFLIMGRKEITMKSMMIAYTIFSGIFAFGAIVGPMSFLQDAFVGAMQDTDYQLFGSSVEEELSLGIENDCSGKVTETLEALELGAYRECHPASLSGGQKQRVTIGAAIVKDSPVIYFDEPTSGLDYDSMVRVSHLIEQLAAAGVIIFVVSHDFEFITRTCSEVLQLDGQDSIKNQVLTPEILLSLSKQYFN